MAANNQGIVHIADRRGGRPICGNRRAHQSTTPDLLHNWPAVCARCAAKHAKWEAIRAKRAETKALAEKVAGYAAG